MIKYSIFETHLGGEPKFMGRVATSGTFNREGVVDQMLALGSTLTKPDIVATLELFNKAVEKLCGLGYRINLDGLLQIAPVIRGKFDSKSDFFTAPRNSLVLTATMSSAMNRRIEQTASLEKIVIDTRRPILYKPVDAEAEPNGVIGRKHRVDQGQTFEVRPLSAGGIPSPRKHCRFIEVHLDHKVLQADGP